MDIHVLARRPVINRLTVGISSFINCAFLGAKKTVSKLMNCDKHIMYVTTSGGKASITGLTAATVLMCLVRIASDEAAWLCWEKGIELKQNISGCKGIKIFIKCGKKQ
jgi:hypothetical protein